MRDHKKTMISHVDIVYVIGKLEDLFGDHCISVQNAEEIGIPLLPMQDSLSYADGDLL